MLKAGEGPLYTLYAASPLKMVGQKIPPVICSLEKEQFAPKPWWLEDYFLFEMVPFQGTCFFLGGIQKSGQCKVDMQSRLPTRNFNDFNHHRSTDTLSAMVFCVS